MWAYIKPAVNAFHIGLTRITKLAINFGAYLCFKHPRALMAFRWLLIAF